MNVPDAVQFRIKFNDFELEHDSFCRKDRMVTLEASKEPSIECGTKYSNKTINGNRFMIEFFTDDQINAKGFELMYTGFTQEDLSKIPTPAPTGKEL